MADGFSLGEYFGRRSWSERQARALARQLLNAVAYLHDLGYIHRDIKPDNILFDHEGHVKLCDLGSAIGIEDAKKDKSRAGTVQYRPPEVLRADPKWTEKADVWAAGLIIYTVTRSAFPFPSPVSGTDQTRSEKMLEFVSGGIYNFNKDDSSPFTDFIQRALHVDPKQRSTAKELLGHPWIADKSLLEEPVLTFPKEMNSAHADSMYQIFTQQQTERISALGQNREAAVAAASSKFFSCLAGYSEDISGYFYGHRNAESTKDS
jgi:serine/threonine protein kinase